MLEFFLQPLVFFGFLGSLFIVGVLFALLFGGKDPKQVRLEESLKQESSLRQEFEKRAKGLQQELEKMRSELAVKNQMYEGLKGQYEELERDMERMAQEPLSIPQFQKQTSSSEEQEPQDPSSKSNQSIADLIQNLKEIQKTAKS